MKEKGVSFSDYQEKTKLSQGEIRERLRKDAILSLKRASTEMEIMQRENIVHDEKEVEKRLLMFSEKLKKPISEVKKSYSKFIMFESARNNLYLYLFKKNLIIEENNSKV
jgi:FKBP-type peptidyl-prolyl cis-trans isomerase (trigger factor)